MFDSADFSEYVTDVRTDFPNSGVAAIENNDKNPGRTVSVTINDGYHYIFFDAVKKTSDQGTDTIDGSGVSVSSGVTTHEAGKMTWQSALAVGKDWAYLYTAHMVAEVNFHQARSEELVDTSALDPQPAVPVTLTPTDFPYLTDEKTVSMTRRYRSPVFGAADNTYHSYNGSDPTTLTFNGTYPSTPEGAPKPTAEQGAAPTREVMTIPGYYFVGWFEKAAWKGEDLNYFLDVANGTSIGEGEPLYQSSSIGKCQPYVLPDNAVVEHTMDLYPVYVKYNIASTTNVVLAVDGVVNKPHDPTWVPEKPTELSTDLEVTAYSNEPVRPAGGETYTIEYVTVTVDGGEPIKLANTAADGGNWVVKYPVVPGRSYLFTAVYKPYVVVFHQNGNVDTEVLVRNPGDAIGRPAPETEGGVSRPVLPTVQDARDAGGNIRFPELNHALFVGWTEAKPDDPAGRPYHFFRATAEKTSYELAEEVGFWTLGETEDTIVAHSMELWPVFAGYTVTVNSNIDNALMGEKPAVYPDEAALQEKVRALVRTSPNTVSTTVKAQEVEGYKFVGWFTGVKQTTPGGEFDDFSEAVPISESGS